MAQIATTRGSIRVPGDKSISHRALILAALSRGTTRISGILDSADVRSTAAVLRALGADVPPLSDDFVIAGKRVEELRAQGAELDCGNSGTTARLLAGVVAGARLTATFTGDASLSRRPMRRVAEPLRAMGAGVELPPHGGLPMAVRAEKLRDIDWSSPIASAQVKSAILLAALVGGVRARVTEPHLSRDHTERMLAARGVTLLSSGATIELPEGQTMRATDIRVPGDPSSAAYFVALGLLADRGAVRVSDVCLNETRTGFIDALLRMGADVSISEQRIEGEESVGTITARPSELHGIAIAPSEIPAIIDELPLLACVATRAKGETLVEGASELRVKESDRIAAVIGNLRAIGARAEERSDGFRVWGEGSHAPLSGAIHTEGDHRIAMAFGILGRSGGNRIQIDDKDCVSVSYPKFWSDLQSALE
jgi:3-phosphoshikimate 1-carboxyvinyltransferase